QSNTPLPVQPQIQLRDASGNNVPLANQVISAAIESGAGAVGGNTSATTNGAGLAVFSGLSISGAAGSYTLRFSATGLAPAISGTIVLGAGGATRLAIVNQPSAIANSGAQLLQQPSVRLRDASGNSVSQAGVSVTATVSTGGTLIGNATRATDANGVAGFTDLGITGLVGNYTLTFTSPGLSPVTSTAIALSAGGGSKLGITTQPSAGGQSGAALTVQPVIQIRDEAGNPVSQAGTTITAAIASGPAGATLGVTVTALTGGAGSAAFTDLTITGPSGSYTLRFTAPGLTQVTSGTITLGVGAPTSMAANSATSQSATVNTTVGAPPSVRVTDAGGNPVSLVAVTFTVFNGGGTIAPASPAVVNTNVNGVATLASWILGPTAGTDNNGVTGAASGLAGSPVTFLASGLVGAAANLGITTQPVGGMSGALLATQPVIVIQDAQGNTVTGDNTTQVTVAISSPAGGALGGTQTRIAVNGVVTFDDVTLAGTVGVNYVLRFTSSPGLTAVNSADVTLTGAGPASKLGIITQPVGAASGAQLATQPVVAIQDAQGNTVTGDNATQVSAAIFSGDGGTLGGILTGTAVSGIVTFTDLTLAGTVGETYVLRFTSPPVLTPVNSDNVMVSAGSATELAITTQPAGGPSGAALAIQPVVVIRDAQGNTVTGDNATQVTAAIFSPAGGTLGGTMTRTAVNGVVTFDDLTLAGTVGVSYVLQFTSDPVLPAVNSGNVTVTSGAPATIAANPTPFPPVSATVGTTVAAGSRPSVLVTDANGNPVADVEVAFEVTDGGGAIVPASPATVATNGAGIATATSWTMGPTAGADNNVATATVAGLAGSPVTFTASGLAGNPNKITITTQPPASAQNGAAFGTAPVVQLRDNLDNPVAVAGVEISIGVASGLSATFNPISATTTGAGQATFTGLTMTGLVGTRTLFFSAPGYVSTPPSTNVDLTPGTATQLAITTQPVGGASGAALATQPVVAIRDAQGNTVTGDNATQVSVAIFSGAGGALGGTLTRTAVNGVVAFSG
ncbi:MAG TPA: carboxypeptidase-like regulatory domain-containing protein, partial [Gemmatimonadales bacterium]|nr:carboxypeptidase-like regulatory domain-containing protein [Gemmatimonadales bacterium]